MLGLLGCSWQKLAFCRMEIYIDSLTYVSALLSIAHTATASAPYILTYMTGATVTSFTSFHRLWPPFQLMPVGFAVEKLHHLAFKWAASPSLSSVSPPKNPLSCQGPTSPPAPPHPRWHFGQIFFNKSHRQHKKHKMLWKSKRSRQHTHRRIAKLKHKSHTHTQR